MRHQAKPSRIELPPIDQRYLLETLLQLLAIPSPSGYTDTIVRHVGEELGRLGLPFQLTRRGAIRATLKGERSNPCRAVVAHVDTLGAMVRQLKPNGRLAVTPVGTWSARFAEGARVTVFTDEKSFRGTILPLMASGHVYNTDVDTQPVGWDQLEVRIDEAVASEGELFEMGFRVGDFVAVDPAPEVTTAGYIVSRHLDNKAGVACLLAAAKAVLGGQLHVPNDTFLLFTVSEEVGSGASSVLHGDISEMVSVDNATTAPGQNSGEGDITVAMADSTGPFDYHLTRRMLELCASFGLVHGRDVFRWYRCDAASALEAGNDIRTALICFGLDASHGYERTHIRSLVSLAQLIGLYIQSPPVVWRDRHELGPLGGFPDQITERPPVPQRNNGER